MTNTAKEFRRTQSQHHSRWQIRLHRCCNQSANDQIPTSIEEFINTVLQQMPYLMEPFRFSEPVS